MVLPLEKIYQRINSQDYSLKDIALYFEKYDGYTLEIETEDKIIRTKIYKKALPHLLGLQHVFKNNNSNNIYYKGNDGFKNIINGTITWDTIRKQIKNNKGRKISLDDLEKRISYLTMFLNTIEKRGYLKKLDKSKLWRKTTLKGNFILYKKLYEDNHLIYPMLSIKELKKNMYTLETFIVEKDILLIGGLDTIKSKNIKLIAPSRKKSCQ